ncbi:MAG: hypothetical protein NVS9B1_12270 [Candidatus Dormibacteraceae bacterium]
MLVVKENMRNNPTLRRLSVLAILTFTIAGGIFANSFSAAASSHREAPLIAADPLADGTDMYAFVAPDDATRVVLIADYVPVQLPAGGPNFYRFGDDISYDINVDNVGDAQKHVVFRYTFTTTTNNPNTFLYNTGPITYNSGTGAYNNWNRPQTYTLQMSTNGGGTFTTLGSGLKTPPSAVGAVSEPDYHSLATAAIATNVNGTGITSFAGQREDPFFVDLGHIFDLLSVNPAGGTDFLKGINVGSLVLSVPKTLLEGPNNDHVIGVWTTSSRNSTSVLAPGTKTESGGLVQVSRLGNPLVNEVVIPLARKDIFNSSSPAGDAATFLNDVLNSKLATYIAALGIDAQAPATGRTDLATVFLSGVPGINEPASIKAGTGQASEELRLNMSIASSNVNPNSVNRMGVLGGELDGFPNGRRLADDVVDIEIQAVDGILCQPGGALTGAATPFGTIAQCRTTAVNPALGDGVNANDVPFQCVFPYVGDPFPPTGTRSTFTGCVAAAVATPTPSPPVVPNTGAGSLRNGNPSGLVVPEAILALLVLGLGALVGIPAYRRRQRR